MVVFVGQVVEELYQGRRQRRRDVRPRVPRGRVFALLRAVTTAFLHDLNVAIVAEQMARGAPVIFVDFVDYDEVAHHAGPTRPESMRTLDTLDRVLGFLADVAAEVNRDYEIVVVSDHGQSQGEPFEQLTGAALDEVVAALVAERAEPAHVRRLGRAVEHGERAADRRRAVEPRDRRARHGAAADTGRHDGRRSATRPVDRGSRSSWRRPAASRTST